MRRTDEFTAENGMKAEIYRILFPRDESRDKCLNCTRLNHPSMDQLWRSL